SIPYTESTTETSGGALQFSTELLEVSITLNVTPHINNSDQIMLDVDQVIDSFIEFVDFGQGSKAPRTQKRSAQTSVLVEDGQTVVIGGIMSDRESISIDGVPILRDIPFIGKLFEHKRKQKTKTELMVFLTPHIVKDASHTAAVFEQERSKLSRDPYTDPRRRPVQLPPAEGTEAAEDAENTTAELTGTVN
ncbi:MAG: type II and III secretion system protein, partial [Armatimonadota bacterium]